MRLFMFVILFMSSPLWQIKLDFSVFAVTPHSTSVGSHPAAGPSIPHIQKWNLWYPRPLGTCNPGDPLPKAQHGMLVT